jgi:hypothetical protein
MSEFDMNGNVVAGTVTKKTPSIFATLVANHKPATVTQARVWRLRDIDAMAGGRNNFLLVKEPSVAKAKPGGGIGAMLYPLQGKPGIPSVTVAGFLKIASEAHRPDGKGLVGMSKARDDLLWNINHKYVEIVQI